jgi:hypothetical protein
MFRVTRMSQRPHHPYPPSAVRVLLYPHAGQGIHDVATRMHEVTCWVLDVRWNDGRRACFLHGRTAGLAAAPRKRGVCGGWKCRPESPERVIAGKAADEGAASHWSKLAGLRSARPSCARHCYETGSMKVKVLPCPSTLSTVTRPPWAIRVSCTIYRPMPVPPGFVV